jgi:transcriptional regulator with GAF, ATPase, and Fis domain
VSLIYPIRCFVITRSFIDSKLDSQAKEEVSVRKSSTSEQGRRMAQGVSEVQPVNGFHQDVESQSTIHSNSSTHDHSATSRPLPRPEAFSSIVYASRAMGEIIDKIERSRDSSAPALITGETGTGKELIARAVHDVSSRHEREFIPFNCGDAAPELVVSELFGYRRGAFTGADRDYKGVIRAADGGALFLDEIGELPLVAQAMFLRFLQNGEIRPLGEVRPISVDVRVIAATNRDLEADVKSGRFRADLFERLNKLRLRIPPLRERREDISPLIKHFLQRHSQEMGKQGLRLSAEAWNSLLSHDWPRNVRELENVLYRLVVFAENHEEIAGKRVIEEIGVCDPASAAVVIEDSAVISLSLPLHEAIDKLERLLIEHALEKSNGNLLRAAMSLEVDRGGLRKMINRLGIQIKKRSGARKSRQ